MQRCTQLPAEALAEVLGGCTSLGSLTLNAHHATAPAVLQAVATATTSLHTLSLEVCVETPAAAAALRRLYERNRAHLQHLTLGHVPPVDPWGVLQDLGTRLPHLKSLSVHGMSAGGLQRLLADEGVCRSLTSLQVQSDNWLSVPLPQLLDRLSGLRTLRLLYCTVVADEQQPPSPVSAVTAALTELHLQECRVRNHTPHALTHLMRGWQHLQTLAVRMDDTEPELNEALAQLSAASLTSLQLVCGADRTPVCLRPLLQQATALTRLDLRYTLLDEPTMLPLSQRAPTLTDLCTSRADGWWLVGMADRSRNREERWVGGQAEG